MLHVARMKHHVARIMLFLSLRLPHQPEYRISQIIVTTVWRMLRVVSLLRANVIG